MKLINQLPSFYENEIIEPIQHSLTIESDILKEEVKNTFNQLFISSATWGLAYWERMLGISKNNFDYQARRENIKAKIRSKGTTTLSVIKDIAEIYSGGEVQIVQDFDDYSFEIVFVGSVGVPKSFIELDNTINNIKPCHLAHTYVFTFNSHSDLSKYTHEKLSEYTHEELRNSSDFKSVNRYNNHIHLSKFTYKQLANFTHEELQKSLEIGGNKNG